MVRIEVEKCWSVVKKTAYGQFFFTTDVHGMTQNFIFIIEQYPAN